MQIWQALLRSGTTWGTGNRVPACRGVGGDASFALRFCIRWSRWAALLLEGGRLKPQRTACIPTHLPTGTDPIACSPPNTTPKQDLPVRYSLSPNGLQTVALPAPFGARDGRKPSKSPFFFGVKARFFFRRKRNGPCPCRGGKTPLATRPAPGGRDHPAQKITRPPGRKNRAPQKTERISAPCGRAYWSHKPAHR